MQAAKEVPERITNAKDFVNYLLDPHYTAFDPVERFPLQISEQRLRYEAQRRLLVLPQGYKRSVAYRKGLENAAEHPRKTVLGYSSSYGTFRLSSCFKAARKLVKSEHGQLVLNKVRDDSYEVSGDRIDIYQEGNKVIPHGHDCDEKVTKPGQSRFNFDPAKHQWCSGEMAVLLHRKYNEQIESPQFFPVLSGPMVTVALALEDALHKFQHESHFCFEAYLNRIVLDKIAGGHGINSVFRFGRPVNYFVPRKLDIAKDPAELTIFQFQDSGLDYFDYFKQVLEPQLVGKDFGWKMEYFSRLLLAWQGMDAEGASHKDFGSLLDIFNYKERLFETLCVVEMLDSYTINTKYPSWHGVLADIFEMNNVRLGRLKQNSSSLEKLIAQALHDDKLRNVLSSVGDEA